MTSVTSQAQQYVCVYIRLLKSWHDAT